MKKYITFVLTLLSNIDILNSLNLGSIKLSA